MFERKKVIISTPKEVTFSKDIKTNHEKVQSITQSLKLIKN